MKTVFKGNEIAHEFTKDISTGRTSNGSQKIQGNYFYSYNTVIAQKIPYKNILILSLTNYSRTTQKHISMLRSAFSHWKIIYIPHVSDQYNSIKTLFSLIGVSHNKFLKARTHRFSHYLDIMSIINSIDFICDHFKINLKNYDDLPFSITADDVAIYEELKQKYSEINALDLTITDGLKNIEAIEVKKAKKLAQDLEKAEKWRKGEIVYCNISPNILRIRPAMTADGKELTKVETNLGVVINADDALKFAKMYLNNTDLVGQKIDGYKITAQTKDKITIGCHVIEKIEVENLVSILTKEKPQ
jgi:hypothetical protein